MLEKYAADAETAKIFSNISNVGGELIAGKALFDLIIFLGDYSVGTSDTFAYLQRIKAIDEIASAIINEIDKVDVDSYIDSTERYKAIVNKCSWYRWLITINGRGESYAYLDSIFDNRAMDVRIDDSVHVDPDSKILTLSTHDTEDEQKRFLVQAYLEKCEDGERNAVEE